MREPEAGVAAGNTTYIFFIMFSLQEKAQAAKVFVGVFFYRNSADDSYSGAAVA